MSPKLDNKRLDDTVQMLGKLIQDPSAAVAKEGAVGVIQSITKGLERVGAEMDRHGLMSGTTNISVTLYAARELERYLLGDKTENNRRLADVYYQLLRAGTGQLSRLDQDLNE